MSSSSSLSIFSHPLFSALLSFFTLILLFFPPFLWTSLLSPALVLAGFLFLSLLRLGATQRQRQRQHQPITITNPQPIKFTQPPEHCTGCSPISSCFEESFVQWNVRAPLEVIYEDYEEEDEEEEEEEEEKEEGEVDEDKDKDDGTVLHMRLNSMERYPSLSLYYPETDSDSWSGAEDEMENVCFMWDDEDRDELIEIALDKKRVSSEFFQLEEENLIEIDISPTAFPMFI